MFKLEYLKRVITETKLYETKRWHLLAFAYPMPDFSDNWKNNPIRYDLVLKPDTLYFVNFDESNNPYLEKIDDYKKNRPLFNYSEQIEVDSSWLKSIKEPIITTVGRLLVNAMVIYPTLKTKVSFINEKITVSYLETLFVNKVVDDDKAKENDIKVTEMIECIDRLTFLTNLAEITNIAATEKTITPPPQLKEIKEKLLKEYQDKLTDPAKVVELENKLDAIDKAYLSDDPAAKNALNKKSFDARKKIYLIYGQAMGFDESLTKTPIVNSLYEGIDTSDDTWSKYVDDSRFGSFSRGHSTQQSGYTYKILQRSLSSIYISSTECDTTHGLTRHITKENYKKLINRYIKVNNNWVLVKTEEEARNYINQDVVIRSPMYCTKEGYEVCYKCMSEVFKDSPTAVTNLASELSSVLMSLMLKMMHSTRTENATIELKDLVT